MSSVLTKGTDDENATEFAHVACTYACVASENPALENSLKTNYYIIVSVLHLFFAREWTEAEATFSTCVHST